MSELKGPSPEEFAAAVEAGVEPENVSAGLLGAVVFGVFVSVAIIATLMLNITLNSLDRMAQTSAEISGYPELKRLQMDAELALGHQEVLDPGTNMYRIPLEQAKRVLVRTEQDPNTLSVEYQRLVTP